MLYDSFHQNIICRCRGGTVTGKLRPRQNFKVPFMCIMMPMFIETFPFLGRFRLKMFLSALSVLF